MLKESELIGAITIYRQEVRPSPTSRSSWSQNFAAQAVIAIENTRLLNELREIALQQQTATVRRAQGHLSSPGELEPVFQAMLENATRICEARFGNLVLYETKMMHFGWRRCMARPPSSLRSVGVNQSSIPARRTRFAASPTPRQLLHIVDLRIDEAYVDGDLPTRALR